MARPRTNAKILELKGAFKKNPARRRTRVAELGIKPGIGDPPADWMHEAPHNGRCQALLNLWNDIVAQDVLRVLNPSHRLLVENTCHLMYKIRRASAGLGKATSGDYAQVKSNLAAMGMTPVDSPRVAEAVRVRDPGEARSPRAAAGGWGELVG